ncbi:MAG: RNA polymerase sigma factor [Elusimicrobia bacterium]|nr:RNA polymerase sigma factor [Elusimicrobiota bacterium]MDE2425081.1 RNA polymerase sigma factor [Elusimicrobiota bacterium]
MDTDPAGDFSELIRLAGEKAYNFAYRLAGNEPDARDLVQEAFVRAYAHFGAYDRHRPFETWLLRILHNIYLDGVRRYAHGHTVSLDAPAPAEETSWEEILPGGDGDLTAEMERRENDALLQKAMESVPLHYRTAVTLCDMEDLSYEQIGEVMSCPVGTVRSRIHQGRILIKAAYERLERKGAPR